MMRKGKNMEWDKMPECDKRYLLSAFNQYKKLCMTSSDPDLMKDNFKTWLLKRGIRNSVTNNQLLLY